MRLHYPGVCLYHNHPALFGELSLGKLCYGHANGVRVVFLSDRYEVFLEFHAGGTVVPPVSIAGN